MDNDKLEQLVHLIRERTTLTSERYFDSAFAENIEQQCAELPRQYRDEFMQIATSYGYVTSAERIADCWLKDEELDHDDWRDELHDTLDTVHVHTTLH